MKRCVDALASAQFAVNAGSRDRYSTRRRRFVHHAREGDAGQGVAS